MFLSAFNDERIVRQAVEFGALAYLVKPLDVRQIVPAVEAALGRSGARGAAAASAEAADAATASAAAVPLPSDSFGVAIDLIERARGAPELPPEAVAVGVLMERHRLSPAAARRMLATIAAARSRTEAAAAAEIVSAVALLSAPPSPTA
jgi:response regulator NasT